MSKQRADYVRRIKARRFRKKQRRLSDLWIKNYCLDGLQQIITEEEVRRSLKMPSPNTHSTAPITQYPYHSTHTTLEPAPIEIGGEVNGQRSLPKLWSKVRRKR